MKFGKQTYLQRLFFFLKKYSIEVNLNYLKWRFGQEDSNIKFQASKISIPFLILYVKILHLFSINLYIAIYNVSLIVTMCVLLLDFWSPSFLME